jgi:hypothetical protein
LLARAAFVVEGNDIFGGARHIRHDEADARIEFARMPFDLEAMTQMNLGSALRSLGERESGTARLEEAVAAYREALQERTRERAPLDCGRLMGFVSGMVQVHSRAKINRWM